MRCRFPFVLLTATMNRKHGGNKRTEMSISPVKVEEPTTDSGPRSPETDKLLPLHADDVASEQQTPPPPTQAKKIGTALFYATSSLGVIFANKIVLSTYSFPSVQTLALLQFASTTIALKLAHLLGVYLTMSCRWLGLEPWAWFSLLLELGGM